ncbi:PEGA domain-containing protein [Sorangium cellulosum]|uniref:PEGA domain-containing protein n=1 Tax=Sorangium cellulosum TaxID=56 RepID=UPI000417FD75|nr:PEGA domain-containing protein [Sorangium cellulosum]
MRAAARPFRRALLWASLSLAAAPAAALADARPTPAQAAQAESFFNAGAEAYGAGQYQVAAEAFLEAHELVPSPSLLFSAAQAFRRHYLTQPSPDALRRAIALYREYLRVDPKAARREEAVAALSSLVPLEARLPAEGLPAAADGGAPAAGAAGAAAPASRGTRLLLSSPAEPAEGLPAAADGGAPAAGAAGAAAPASRGTRLLLSSPAEGARVSVDGQPFVSAPLVAQVAPGAHRVRVQAAGHYDEELTVIAVDGELMPRHVVLRPKPAMLRVTGTSGASLVIDGQARATLPTAAAIAVEPGVHVVEVSLPGRELYRREIRVTHEQDVRLDADLRTTSQRLAAWTVLGAGAAGAAATGVLAGLALARQAEAVDLRDRRDATSLTPSERDRYNAAVSARGGLGAAAAVAGGVSFVTLAVGLRLFLFDDPRSVVAPPAPPAPPPKAPGAELTVGLLSAGVRGRF